MRAALAISTQLLKNVRFSNSMSATAIGLMANMILPVRLGEIVRAVVLGYVNQLIRALLSPRSSLTACSTASPSCLLPSSCSSVPLPFDHGWQQRLRWGAWHFSCCMEACLCCSSDLHRAPTQVLQGVRQLGAWLPNSLGGQILAVWHPSVRGCIRLTTRSILLKSSPPTYSSGAYLGSIISSLLWPSSFTCHRRWALSCSWPRLPRSMSSRITWVCRHPSAPASGLPEVFGGLLLRRH